MRALFSRSQSIQFGITRGRRRAELGAWALGSEPLVKVTMRYEGPWAEGRPVEATYCFLPIPAKPFWQSLVMPYEFAELLVGSRRATKGTFHFQFLFADGSTKATQLDIDLIFAMYRGRGPKPPGGVTRLEESRHPAAADVADLGAEALRRKSEEMIEAIRKAEEERKQQAEAARQAAIEAQRKAQQAAAGSAPKPAAAGGAAPAAAADDFDTGGAKVGIFYGSTTGNTSGIADAIAAELGGVAKVVNVSTVSPKAFEKFEHLILGVPTWHIGEMQEDWAEMLTKLEGLNLKGKKCAIFGLGDGVGYPETYVDAMMELWEAFKPFGAELVGLWPTEGYNFAKSKAILDGKFIGVVIDIENQNNLTDERVKQWSAQLRSEIGL